MKKLLLYTSVGTCRVSICGHFAAGAGVLVLMLLISNVGVNEDVGVGGYVASFKVC
jgi:hypothetical protein